MKGNSWVRQVMDWSDSWNQIKKNKKRLTSVFRILGLTYWYFPPCQSSYAGENAANRIFILVTKFFFILEKERKKESFQTILLLNVDFWVFCFANLVKTKRNQIESFRLFVSCGLIHEYLGCVPGIWIFKFLPVWALPQGQFCLGAFYPMPSGSHGRGVVQVSCQTMIPSQNRKKQLISEFIKRQNAVYLNDSDKACICRAHLFRTCWKPSFPMISSTGKLVCSLLHLCAWRRCVWTIFRNKRKKCNTLTNFMF